MKADVVVPVYRDVTVTKACLESVLRHSGEALGLLIVVDDHGPDAQMKKMLRALRQSEPRIRLIENEENLGFVSSANRGLSLRTQDVVLLNSDTRVTEGWLAELLEVLHAEPHIAAVSPLSNNATLCSVPDFCESSPIDVLETASLDLQGLPRFTEMPTAVGFCMALRDEVLTKVGLFDPIFGRGYNEENDWCQRVRALDFKIARANHCLVFHQGQVSFREERTVLEAHNARRLSLRWPKYLDENAVFAASPESRMAATAVRACLGTLRLGTDLIQGGPAELHRVLGTSAQFALTWGKAAPAVQWSAVQAAQGIIVRTEAECGELFEKFRVNDAHLVPTGGDDTQALLAIAKRPRATSYAARAALTALLKGQS